MKTNKIVVRKKLKEAFPDFALAYIVCNGVINTDYKGATALFSLFVAIATNQIKLKEGYTQNWYMLRRRVIASCIKICKYND